MDLSGKTALVTGASSGLGAEFARLLADRNARLILTARRELKLEALAHELRKTKRVQVEVITADLAHPEGAAGLFAKTEGAGRPVDVLINNAGAGAMGDFLDLPWETARQQLQLNIVSATELAHRFGEAMRGRRSGYILNVASVAAYSALAGYATYAASKAYVLNFSYALTHELRGSGVVVGCLSPGLTTTEFHQVAHHRLPKAAALFAMKPADAAERGLNALFDGSANHVPGFFNKLGAAMLKLLPGAVAVAAASAATEDARKR